MNNKIHTRDVPIPKFQPIPILEPIPILWFQPIPILEPILILWRLALVVIPIKCKKLRVCAIFNSHTGCN